MQAKSMMASLFMVPSAVMVSPVVARAPPRWPNADRVNAGLELVLIINPPWH